MQPRLTISLSALAANYRLLREKHSGNTCAAVVKANAYGLGVEAVSKTLYAEGCREFFVATLTEGIELRGILADANIGVFQGIFAGEEKDYAHYRLTPVINTPAQLELAAASEQRSVILHIDTGMTRLGLSQTELETLLTNHQPPATNHLILMSHLACANEPSHEKNAEQLARFQKAAALFPHAKKSLANSSGIFLSPEFHFDVARPGCALYGINPTDGLNPMQPVATLSAPILQVRELDRDETVGYGGTYEADEGTLIAIIGIGYADGFMRNLGNHWTAMVAGHHVPVVGRISMDMIALDVSNVPESLLATGTHVELLNKELTVDAMATAAGTIGYEIFTRLGARVARVYSTN